MTRTALVTGATGFIGGRLAARLLERGWNVHVLLRPHSDQAGLPAPAERHIHGGDVGDLTRIVRQARPDVVFHLASLYLAEHRPDQIGALIESNVQFPAQLAQAMADGGATRLINTGTAWQHFQAAGYNPVNLYAATKQACEDLLRYYHEARDLSVVTLKLFDTFGEGDKRRKLIAILIDAARSGETLDMSAGDQIIDLTHVDDVVDAFEIAAHRLLGAQEPLFQTYLVSGRRANLREHVAAVAEALDGEIRVNFGARPYRAREVMVPVEAGAAALPGWRPARDFGDAIRAIAAERKAGA